MDFIYLLGRFHVVALHLPIGIGLALVALQLAASKDRYHQLGEAAPFLWGATAVSSIGTMVLGYSHYLEGGFEGQVLTLHMISGTALAVIASVGSVLCSRRRRAAETTKIGLVALLAVLILVTGHTGGTLTHGSTYLVEFAPEPIRAVFGLEPRRPRVTDLALADPYLDVVQPILRRRCADCHGTERTENDLSLLTYEATLRGGELGRVILPGRSAISEVIRRVTLPPDDESFMPQEGKTPLTENEIAIIAWWIDADAPANTTMSEVETPADVRSLIETMLGL